MSEKITVALDLLGRIRRGYDGRRQTIRETRNRSGREIAQSRQVEHESVRDVYQRQLAPEIKGTSAFDAAVEEWLTGKGDTLRHTLLHHSETSHDASAVERFFAENRHV